MSKLPRVLGELPPLPTLDFSSVPGLFYVTKEGRVRIEGGRVPLERVVYFHREGKTAEEIAQDFDLDVSDVKSAVSFYTSNRAAVEAYVAELDRQSELILASLESAPPESIRGALAAIQDASRVAAS